MCAETLDDEDREAIVRLREAEARQAAELERDEEENDEADEYMFG